MFLTDDGNTDKKFLSEVVQNVKFTDKNLIIIYQTIDKLLYGVNNEVENLIQALYKQFAEDNNLKEIITDLIYIADSFKNLSIKDFRAAALENAKKIRECQVNAEKKQLASGYKNLNDEDVESIEYQMQLREKLKNKQKIGESINE